MKTYKLSYHIGRGVIFKIFLVATIVILLAGLTAQAAQGPQPSICTRACWGARSPACSITQMSSLTRATVHHTAGAGEWTTDYETGKARVRGVQNYHIDTRGWCDIGYHFMISAGGHIYEAIHTAMTGLPRGAHDACNNNSFGFTLLGYYHPPYNQTFTSAARASLEAVIAWRMPSSWSATGSGTYCGKSVGTLDGHYKVVATACPGDVVIPQIPSLRTGVMNRKNPAPPMGPSMFFDLGGGAMNIYRWSSTGSGFSIMTTTGISSGYSLSQVGNHMAATDVNADGKTDNIVAYQYPDGTMRLHVFLNGSWYQGPDGWFQSGTFSMANVGGRMVGGDFNGDGRGDVAMIYDNGGGLSIYRFLSTGSSFTYDSVVVATSGYDLAQVGENVAASDVNGDGRSDLVAAYQYADGTMRLHVFLNGNSYQGPAGWFQSGTFSMANVAGRMAGGDFDGNGRGDIVMFYDNGSGVGMYRFLSSGSAFSYDLASISSGYDLAQVGSRVGAGDINGDGKADAVTAYQYPDGTFRFHAFINGNSYAGPTGWFQSGSFNLSNVGGRLTMGRW